MKCPDCLEKMEYEDASTGPDLSGKKKGFVAANYFCPGCQSYWRWDKFDGLSLMREGYDAHVRREINKQRRDVDE